MSGDISNDVTDKVFEGGHCDCVSGQVSITMCADGARLVALLLSETAAEWDRIDPEVAYYMRAFSADVEIQISRQQEDPDGFLRSLG